MNTKQNNIGNINNKYISRKKSLKYKHFKFNADLEHDFENCDCCYQEYDYDEDLENEIYVTLDNFIDSCADNFYKIKYVKEIFKEDFLNYIIKFNKYSKSEKYISVPIIKENLSENYKKIIDRLIDDDQYNFKFEIFIYFKDLTFNEVEKINLRIYNKYLNGGYDIYSSKRLRTYIDINIIKIKNNIKIYNNNNIETIIESHHQRQSDKIIFNDVFKSNSQIIFNYFIEDCKFIKDGIFNINDLINNKNSRDLLDLYIF